MADRVAATPATPAAALAVARGRRRWPLLLIGASAGTATWSGWVGLGELTGFGVVHPLPGIWDDLTLNTAITLPIGVEAYAVYALAVATDPRPLTRIARRWAWTSAAGALLLGMAGQTAYHLLAAHGVTTAPGWVVALVSSLPVLVLGAASLLHHLASAPAVSEATPHGRATAPVSVAVLPVGEYGSVVALPSAGTGVSTGTTKNDRPSATGRARTAAASTPRSTVTEDAESPSDEALVAALAALPDGEAPPSIRAVMRAHGIGQTRATRAVRAAAALRAAAHQTATSRAEVSETDDAELPANDDETSQERADQPDTEDEIETDEEPEKSEEEPRRAPDREQERENQTRKLRAATQEPRAGITPMHHRPSRSLQDR